jgi:hypothetical protein
MAMSEEISEENGDVSYSEALPQANYHNPPYDPPQVVLEIIGVLISP